MNPRHNSPIDVVAHLQEAVSPQMIIVFFFAVERAYKFLLGDTHDS